MCNGMISHQRICQKIIILKFLWCHFIMIDQLFQIRSDVCTGVGTSVEESVRQFGFQNGTYCNIINIGSMI
jgi:hypothetical protein